MKKILIIVCTIAGIGIASRTLIQSQREKASEVVRIPDASSEKEIPKKEAQKEKAPLKPISANSTLQEKIRVLEEQIVQYENILKSENAIDRINHNEVSEEQRQHYFDIIRDLTSMRIQKNNLRIQELEQEG